MRAVADLVLTVALILVFVAWCGVCIWLPMAAVQRLGLPDFYEAITALAAGALRLWFALWATARVTGNRRI